jgi:hypothetical protein
MRYLIIDLIFFDDKHWAKALFVFILFNELKLIAIDRFNSSYVGGSFCNNYDWAKALFVLFHSMS